MKANLAISAMNFKASNWKLDWGIPELEWFSDRSNSKNVCINVGAGCSASRSNTSGCGRVCLGASQQSKGVRWAWMCRSKCPRSVTGSARLFQTWKDRTTCSDCLPHLITCHTWHLCLQTQTSPCRLLLVQVQVQARTTAETSRVQLQPCLNRSRSVYSLATYFSYDHFSPPLLPSSLLQVSLFFSLSNLRIISRNKFSRLAPHPS